MTKFKITLDDMDIDYLLAAIDYILENNENLSRNSRAYYVLLKARLEIAKKPSTRGKGATLRHLAWEKDRLLARMEIEGELG